MNAYDELGRPHRLGQKVVALARRAAVEGVDVRSA